ncbi:cobalamin-binding protein [Oceanospirillum sediminis]|uniref:cobalamin-binding protein n=1 Tax=Oceanospirillum sediminis TaxID=2760088 RepID=UPI001C71E0C1|nr:cobalamin-binding protein [Oceanospirillum sediminis]
MLPICYFFRQITGRYLKYLITSGLLSLIGAPLLQADIRVQDDTGTFLQLSSPANRVISLAPSVTELIFSAGAGNKLVGVVTFSNYPEAATQLPVIGSYNHFDLEKILALKPDLVIGWKSGNDQKAIHHLKALGIPVYLTETRFLEQIPETVKRLGQLMNTRTIADQAALQFNNRLAALKNTYQQQQPVRVFYQVWNRPLITINQQNLISQVIGLCGGQNVFAELDSIAPRIDIEAVLAANPDAIIASGMDKRRPEWLDEWRRWPSLKAVKNNQLHFIPPDHIQRQTLRVLTGAEQMCQQLATTRQHLSDMSGNPISDTAEENR